MTTLTLTLIYRKPSAPYNWKHQVAFTTSDIKVDMGLSMYTVIVSLVIVIALSWTPGGNVVAGLQSHSIAGASSRQSGSRSPIPLFAVKKKQKKGGGTSKKSGNSSNGGGGGFGGASKSKSLEGKVRSVSGHTGSGTKPLRQAANNFDDLRNEYGQECCKDLYCRSPLNDPLVLWFIGKVAGAYYGIESCCR